MPNWRYNSRACILHFHGPKPDVLEAITQGRWPRDSATAITLAQILDAHADDYQAWLDVLGDALQYTAPAVSLRLQNLASALCRYRATLPKNINRAFMNVKIFAD